MKHIIALLVTVVLPLMVVGQSVTVMRSLEMLPNSQAVVQFNNIFGNWENREVDDSFPYVVIQMNLAGDAKAVSSAKQKIGLEVGAMFQVTATDKNQPNKILFLVPRGVRNIYVVCGDGCEKQLLHSGTLVENKVYECTVAFQTNASIANDDVESIKKQNEQMKKQMEEMQQLLLSMQHNQNATVNNSPSQSVIEVSKGITINLNNPEDARFYAMSGSELYSYASKCEGETMARVLAIGAYKGDLNCQCALGGCYYSSEGVARDCNEAVKWYRKAAEQGNSNAYGILAFCYAIGRGVPNDYYESAKWYRKSAEQGFSLAQKELGNYYYFGRGVTKDYYEAVKWYRKAAEQGDSEAQVMLGICYENGQGVTNDYREAVKWYRKAAEQEDTNAQYKLGYCYEYGKGVAKNISEAVKWYKKAAEVGDYDAEDALTRLGYR